MSFVLPSQKEPHQKPDPPYLRTGQAVCPEAQGSPAALWLLRVGAPPLAGGLWAEDLAIARAWATFLVDRNSLSGFVLAVRLIL